MADRLQIAAEERPASRKDAKKLRREGWIPAVVYGQQDTRNIKIENLPLRRVLRSAGTTNLIDLAIGGKKHTVLAKDVQVHPTRGSLIHVDFYEVNMSEKIIVEASLITTGIAAPEEEGLGTATQVIYDLEIECLPDNLVSEIEVDLSKIRTPEDMIIVQDLVIPEGITVLSDPEAIVARFEYIQAEEVEAEEEELVFAPAADEVEVIGRGKSDEDEEGENEG